MVSQNFHASMSPADLFAMGAQAQLSPQGLQDMSLAGMKDSSEARSPLHCKYPSKKCWNMRVEKRNGELHKFCEYHRQKANSNQRRMEQRRKQMRLLQMTTEQQQQPHSTQELEPLPLSTMAAPQPQSVDSFIMGMPNMTKSFAAASPCSVDRIDFGAYAMKRDMCMDVPVTLGDMVDFDVGQDAAVDCMMLDDDIEMEPSDRPVDLYEADLFFLEHFMTEITKSVV
ncbi:hypothetical protein P43SY_000870 [Pythium insidiosum]|uniref:Uncharacterized protein n=1 Tax=Pythium insidiosum TaxID=114742 RepID=A0AAD5QC86_PYTIN|nr:hypothetical protein P43SY_000870 [Pythium insidiosum]